ncbi:MAG: lipase family protein [Persicimonas sp.]
MKYARLWLIVMMSVALSAQACGDDSQGGATTDAGVTEDDASDVSSDGHTEPDANPDADADADADASWSCDEFPSAQIAPTTQTEALADDPARCGQADYRWIDDSSLGEVTSIGSTEDFPTPLIEGFLSSEGVEPPREVRYDARVVQYEYTTQDRGQSVLASSMVAHPVDYDPQDGPLDVLLFLHGTTGFTDACAPSNDFAYQGLAALMASFGYFVVAPDYIGLKGTGEETGFLHPYLVGQSTAIASLDAVRAAANLPAEERGDVCINPRMVTFGGSQGGHAALWVDRLAPYYAGELDLLGSVATVPPADMVGQMERAVDELVDATGNTVAFLGAAAPWYGYGDRLDEVFASPLDEDVPEALGSTCEFSDMIDEPETTADIFTQSLIDEAANGALAEVDPWGCITAENGLTSTSIERLGPTDDSYGILVVLGEDDELVHTPIEREAFDELCGQGMPMEFLECAGAGHGETTFFALPEILDFVDARMAGEVFDQEAPCEHSAPVQCRGTQ